MDVNALCRWIDCDGSLGTLLSALARDRHNLEDDTLYALQALLDDPRRAQALARRLREGLADEDGEARWRAELGLGPLGLNARWLEWALREALLDDTRPHQETSGVVSLLGAWTPADPTLLAFCCSWIEALAQGGSHAFALGTAKGEARDVAKDPASWRAWPDTFRAALDRERVEETPTDRALWPVTEAAARNIGRAARQRSGYAAWLLEGLKLPLPGARRAMFEALRSVPLPPGMLYSGMGELVRFASVTSSRPAISALREAVEEAYGNPRWWAPLLGALQAHPGIAAVVADALCGDELGDPFGARPPLWLCSEDTSYASILRAHLKDATPLTRLIATDLLARRPGEAPLLQEPLASLLGERPLPGPLNRWLARSITLTDLGVPLRTAICRALGRGSSLRIPLSPMA